MPRGRGHGPRMSNEKAKDFKGTMKKLMAAKQASASSLKIALVSTI